MIFSFFDGCLLGGSVVDLIRHPVSFLSPVNAQFQKRKILLYIYYLNSTKRSGHIVKKSAVF